MTRSAFPNTSVIGVDDGSFRKGITKTAILAVVLPKETTIETVKIKRITVDGLDATEKLVEALKELRFDSVFLAGISFAGFNVIDPTVIHRRFKKPVVIISRTKPNNVAVKRALKRHFEDWEKRRKVFEKTGHAYRILVVTGGPPIYVETVGVSVNQARVLSSLSLFVVEPPSQFESHD